MKIAVVGTGIAGLTAARLLCRDHELSVFEARERIGGHTHTVTESSGRKTFRVDTGFIVFNERTYPNFVSLLRKLQVPWQKSDMSFSVHCERTGVEYCPSSLNRLFAQCSNILRPGFWGMLGDLIHFRKALPDMMQAAPTITLADYLKTQRFGRWFRELFIVPMGAAIWSADPRTFADFPACMFARFFHNHGFLERQQPQWLALKDGSQAYLDSLTAPYREAIHTNMPVQSIDRNDEAVTLHFNDGSSQQFDEVILALHSDQALKLLQQPTDTEQEVLSAIPYQANDVVLHTDTRLLPQRRKAWASWNYRIPHVDQNTVNVTYNMNQLQNLDAPETFCVTLNATDAIDPAKIRRRFTYYHPVYTPAALAAQKRHDEISGKHRIHYCGAYWGYGFHEDGVNSALAVAKHFGKGIDDV